MDLPPNSNNAMDITYATNKFNASYKKIENFKTTKLGNEHINGHLLRNETYYIPQLIIKGKIQGKRGINRQKIRHGKDAMRPVALFVSVSKSSYLRCN